MLFAASKWNNFMASARLYAVHGHGKLHLFPERAPQKFPFNVANAHNVRSGYDANAGQQTWARSRTFIETLRNRDVIRRTNEGEAALPTVRVALD